MTESPALLLRKPCNEIAGCSCRLWQKASPTCSRGRDCLCKVSVPEPRQGYLSGGPSRTTPMSRTLILLGILFVVIGVLWPWLGKLGLGRLPGDIVIERENFRLYLPITTSLLSSLLLSLIFWFLNR